MVVGAAGPPPDRPPEASATAIQVAVAGRLDRLVVEIGIEEPVARAVQVFLERLHAMIESIVETDDARRQHELTHSLAGSAETLGATALGAIARQIMAVNVAGSCETSEARLLRLQEVGEATSTALLAELERRGWGTPAAP